MSKLFGYIISSIPLLISIAIVIRYAFFVAQPVEPPNLTLQGTEIFFPVGLGIILALVFGIQIPLRKASLRKDLAIWTGVSISPFVILVLYLYVPHWFN